MPRSRLSFPCGTLATACLLLLECAYAGGPAFVAGTSYFDPGVKGTPLVWPNNTVSYYTDQGDLSPVVPGPSADALVATAFARWTSIPTVALVAAQAGQLAEDVNGANVALTNGVLNLPADIQPTALSTPVGIVYDQDGQVTETLLGAGSSSDCVNYAAYGGLDNFAPTGNFAHALVILNGMCVQDTSQLPDFEYRLVRVLGRMLGLDASQANINVWTGQPPPTDADRAGFPVMHAVDLPYCVPITKCLPKPDQPTMDDRAALSRLYPVTPANQANYDNKIVFSSSTVRIHGVVSFPGTSGPGQGMQGVNVVARWIDPATGQPSRTAVASSVSGFLYHGNIGNPVTGWTDASGQNLNRWGSDDPALQGYFDLAGLEFPPDALTANYQITVERIDPEFSEAVGSYAPLQVDPSGGSPALVISAFRSTDTELDLIMTNAARTPTNVPNSQTFLAPVAVPSGGEWTSWLNNVGGTNYYSFSAQANRTLSVEAVAVDEQGNPTQDKVQPVIGIWSLAAPEGTPPPSATPNPFISNSLGLSRLDAQVLTTTDFRIGVSDWRGDGRPDYAHHMRVLYADTISPSRASAAGGTALEVRGMGFRSGMQATVGGVPAAILDYGANHLLLQTSALADGVQTVVVSDPSTLGFSTMSAAVTVGAGPVDTIHLLPVANPNIPVGGSTANPLTFFVTAPDGTPVVGATVGLSTTNGLTLDLCRGATSCSVFSNESGQVLVNVGVTQVGVGLVTAQLAPASYAKVSTDSGTLSGVSSSLDMVVLDQLVKVEQGTTVTIPLLARVLNAGTPQPGVQVSFQKGTGQDGVLGGTSATTDADGNVSTTLTLSPVSGDVDVTACVTQASNLCAQFRISPIPPSALRVNVVAGSQQLITEGQPPTPVTVLVTDGSTPLNPDGSITPIPVFGAPVSFLSILSRSGTNNSSVTVDDVIVTATSDSVILGSQTNVASSNINGMATMSLWPSTVTAGEHVSGLASVDSGAEAAFYLQTLPGLVPAGSARPSVPMKSFPRAKSAPSSPKAQTANTFVGLFNGMFAGFSNASQDGDPLVSPPQATPQESMPLRSIAIGNDDGRSALPVDPATVAGIEGAEQNESAQPKHKACGENPGRDGDPGPAGRKSAVDRDSSSASAPSHRSTEREKPAGAGNHSSGATCPEGRTGLAR